MAGSFHWFSNNTPKKPSCEYCWVSSPWRAVRSAEGGARRTEDRPPGRYPGATNLQKPCCTNDAWADTTTAHGRLMLTVLGGLAEFERELIHSRTSEGRERAKARGVKLGRKPKLTTHQKAEAIKRRANGEGLADIGRSYNVSGATISRLGG